MEIKNKQITINKGDTIITDVSFNFKSGNTFIPGNNDKVQFVIMKHSNVIECVDIKEDLKIKCPSDDLVEGIYTWMITVETNGIHDTPLSGTLVVRSI
jgi:hypothetical protein